MAAIVRRLLSRGLSVRTGSDDGGHAPNPDPGVVAHRVPYPVTAPRGKQGQQAEDWKDQRDPGRPASPGRPEVGGKEGPDGRSRLKRGWGRASRKLRERGSAGRGRGVVTPRHWAAAPSIADAGGCREMRSSNAKPGSGWATSSPSGIGSGSSPQTAGPRAGAIGNGAVGSPTLARIRCTGAASVTNAIMRICAPQPGHASSATRFCPSVVRRAGECPVPVSLRPVRSGGEAAGQDQD